MRAITVSEPGGPENLVLSEVDDLPLGGGEVRIRVAAAGLNRADIAQRQGTYPSPPGAPEWPGLEVSGTVTETAPDVTGVRVGDRVCALLAGGGYAEEVVVHEGLTLPLPEHLDLVEAAALPETLCTVWSNVFMSAELQPGETLLVHGGGSGIGTTAIQMAKLGGARVAVTAGSAEKLAACAELGADILINYREEDFVARIKEETDGAGANVILDIVGGAYAASNVRALAVDGRIMVIGNQSGVPAEFNLAHLMVKRGRIWGTTLRARPLEQKLAIVAGVREHVWPWVAEGRLRPLVDSTFSFAEVADAHRRMEGSAHTGKILLTP
ncbi:NAD(P)H-quinone oxidoreductase [Salinibacterium sp. dk2585]|uniref:NAD(P)H-quinone oxidoreductase n=1 Tax=unclassified Salinibacterium TaxID=2632331 RepID=UPI0011C244F1|nr:MULTISPECIES: NAD(P)H-quinone oxidoreductase [unclassified Salinibacterium]QEE61979.1 NAD(P)H-quinone oxidoreductase [Salinibacterium sp. dk2585]TXK54466.1 NAD(P)H-quinone oxidoreductase [Salinibacterium sp. dk5596]